MCPTYSHSTQSPLSGQVLTQNQQKVTRYCPLISLIFQKSEFRVNILWLRMPTGKIFFEPSGPLTPHTWTRPWSSLSDIPSRARCLRLETDTNAHFLDNCSVGSPNLSPFSMRNPPLGDVFASLSRRGPGCAAGSVPEDSSLSDQSLLKSQRNPLPAGGSRGARTGVSGHPQTTGAVTAGLIDLGGASGRGLLGGSHPL